LKIPHRKFLSFNDLPRIDLRISGWLLCRRNSLRGRRNTTSRSWRPVEALQSARHYTNGRAFLTYLAVEHRVAPSTLSQALAALLFLYREVIRRPLTGLGGYCGIALPAVDPDWAELQRLH
jgi:Phage integrase, N-terminal SAM-like domain